MSTPWEELMSAWYVLVRRPFVRKARNGWVWGCLNHDVTTGIDGYDSLSDASDAARYHLFVIHNVGYGERPDDVR